MSVLNAPFPYFGGKTRVADLVWSALGQPKHYIEPFFGSGAVLLARPNYDPTHHIETVCDKDSFVANVWRGLQHDPDEVAKWCDWPVNHADLSARKRRLIENEDRLLENLITDDEWYDAKLAGYWIWAASCWIGSGLTRPSQVPHLSSAGRGVHKLSQVPRLSDAGMGVHKLSKVPRLSDAGVGVHKLSKVPHLSNAGRGVHNLSERRQPDSGVFNPNLYRWFRELQERLRYVRVVCGDWSRVCGGDWQDKCGTAGLFFDPPYGVGDRDTDVYHHDSTAVSADVRAWALARGDRPSYRIVIAGYDTEGSDLVAAGWREHQWSASGGYANTGNDSEKNRHRERLWFSPHCAERRLAQQVMGL